MESRYFSKIEDNSEFRQLYCALLKIYKHKYPHNPEGVLKYHINRGIEGWDGSRFSVKEINAKHKVNQ